MVGEKWLSEKHFLKYYLMLFEILSDYLMLFGSSVFFYLLTFFLLFTKYICCLEKLYNEDRASILEALRDLLFKSKHRDASL